MDLQNTCNQASTYVQHT